jgi:hypothetical protein
MRRILALATVALAATGCGSDLGPPQARPASPVRIALAAPAPDLSRGVRDAVDFVGARRVPLTADADLIVTDEAAQAIAEARSTGEHVLLVGAPPAESLPPTLLAVEIDRSQLGYLAGALAAETGARSLALPGAEPGMAAAARAGVAAGGGGTRVTVAACGTPVRAAALYAEEVHCLPAHSSGQVIAAERLPGADQLAVLGPRPWAIVAAAARAVQDGRFTPGESEQGLAEDALGFTWIAPSVPADAVDRLQRIEDAVRAGHAVIPAVPPVAPPG